MMKLKFKVLSVVGLASAVMVFGFQNCAQTSFTQIPVSDGDAKSIVGAEVQSDDDHHCQSVPLNAVQINLGSTAEGHQILGYKIGEINCSYTSFLVKVLAYGQFETYLVYHKKHNSNQIDLISKSEQGQPVFVYPNSVSVSADNKYVIYSPHKIVDRSPTPIVPEFIHRRNLTTGAIDIVNKTANGDLISVVYPEHGFNKKTAESKDGNIILFESAAGRGGVHLHQKNMTTGELRRITGNDSAGQIDLTYPVTSYSISHDGLKTLLTRGYEQTAGSGEYLLLKHAEGQTSILTGNGTASHYDGVDEKVVGVTIVAGAGKYVYFEGDYRGGRRQQIPNRQIIKKDLETGLSKVVSRNDQTEQVGYNWSLQSVSENGRYFCFLSTQTNLTNVNAQTLVAENTNAYVKDTETGRIVKVSNLVNNSSDSSSASRAAFSSSLSANACAISADGMNVTYGVGDLIYQTKINWNSRATNVQDM